MPEPRCCIGGGGTAARNGSPGADTVGKGRRFREGPFVYVSYARVVRSGALDLVGAHLRTRVQDTDVFQCLDARRRDDVARRSVDWLGPPA